MSERPALLPFQDAGATWLSKQRLALLADEMGVGKTAQAIRALDLVHAKKILVICPSVAKINWAREFERFSKTPRKVKLLSTSKDDWSPEEVLVTSFTLSAKISVDRFARFGKFDAIIVDEAHYLKSIDSTRSQNFWGVKGLCRHTERVWLLTGTPAPNNASELWPILYSFGVTPLRYPDFVERYCHSYTHMGRVQVTGTRLDRIPEVKTMLSRIMLRRKKVDVLPQLPPMTFSEIIVPKGEVDITREASFVHYTFPEDRRAELVETLEKDERDIMAVLDRLGSTKPGMDALEAMANSVATLRRYRGLQKVPATIELIRDELKAGAYEKVVLLALHRDVINNLRVGLSEFGPVTLYGGMDDEKKQRHVDLFQRDPETRVFIGNIQAMGTAITLTAAHQVVFVEQDWVPGNNAQAAMRCHRLGQKNAVTVRVISLDDPIDERVNDALRRKTKELTELFSG